MKVDFSLVVCHAADWKFGLCSIHPIPVIFPGMPPFGMASLDVDFIQVHPSTYPLIPSLNHSLCKQSLLP